MLFAELAETSIVLAATSKRTEKVVAIAAVLAGCPADEIAPAVSFLTGDTSVGRTGVGWSTLSDVRPLPAEAPTLTIAEVAATIGDLAAVAGSGSVTARRRILHDLLARATVSEQRLLLGILAGELRQGAVDGVVAAGVAKAAGVQPAELQRAAMFLGSLPGAARIALTGGSIGLAAVELQPSCPVQPMLASTAVGVGAALAETGVASVEWKLDGARVQAHRAGGTVRLFTRNLNEVTDRLNGVVDVVASLPGGDLVLDGEVLGLDADGGPRRFQDTIGDFAADMSVARGGGLQAFFFDVLHAGHSLVDEPLHARRQVLEAVVPAASRLPSIVTADPGEADAFLDRAIAAGHEGVMVKAIESRYEAGRRGGSWRKVKPVHTLDLVVIGVEWGHGRRQGWLSNLHLAARGSDAEWVMVGKTFKGLTDELLRWQTDRFLQLKFGEGSGGDRHVVYVRPEQVVEVAVDGVQVSTRYPGGVALRFARVRRYRPDKRAADADTIERVQSLLR